MTPESGIEEPGIEDLLRILAPQVLGVLVRRFGDFDAAEDGVQEALFAAARHWPVDGVPANPRAWLIQTASRRVTDQFRSDSARRQREQLAARREPYDIFHPHEQSDVDISDRDDTLTLLVMCCHPALTTPSAIALTLRAVGGLTTAEIARAFLVPESTMAQRISRAKRTIQASGVPFRLPVSADGWAQAMRSVLRVLYLIFNEGYTSSAGDDLNRVELSAEAIRLTRLLHRLRPVEAEAAGLLALMLLTDARRAARSTDRGALVPLAEQDRSRWDRRMIVEGLSLLTEVLGQGAIGEYQLQAAVAGVHDEAARVEDTEWPKIVTLYGLLERMTSNPMVTLNLAIAVAMVDGPEPGLALLSRVEEQVPGHYRIDAVRAHLLEMAGDTDAAIGHYRLAASRTASVPERDYLTLKVARLRR